MSTASPIARALTLALANSAIQRQIERLPHRFLVTSGDETLVVVPGGDTTAEVCAAAPTEVWREMLHGLPSPGRQSAGAAMRSDCDFQLKGERLAAAQTVPLLEMLIEEMRRVANPTAQTAVHARTPMEKLRSRYLRVDGLPDGGGWLFEESAGDANQPVMLLLHTAGADARQWHALMTDEVLGRDWHLVAFDMPSHGRSPPLDNWTGEPWELNTERYLACIVAWMEANKTRQVAVVGCSMGAAIGLAFLARYPEKAFGAILLETPWRSPGRRTDLLDHPAVHGGRFGAAWVQALMSPLSPERHRRHATWIYSQAAPGVYEGDLAFYSDEFDAAVHVPHIKATKTPLFLMTGDYDYSASPAESMRIAEAVPGSNFLTLEGMGHFPMTENPERLLTHFVPAAQILRRRALALGDPA